MPKFTKRSPVQLIRLFFSLIVLLFCKRLQSTTKHPIFIANRVRETLELTTIDQRNYVSSSENPVDAGTRGLSEGALKSSSWYLGPECLRSGDWPFKPDNAVLNDLKKGTGEETALPSSKIVASPAKIIQWESRLFRTLSC